MTELWKAEDSTDNGYLEDPEFPSSKTECSFGRNPDGSYYLSMENGPFSGYPSMRPDKKSLSELYRAIGEVLGGEDPTPHRVFCGVEFPAQHNLLLEKEDHTHFCGEKPHRGSEDSPVQHKCWVCDMRWISRVSVIGEKEAGIDR